MASTAESMLPNAVIRTTGVSGRASRSSPTSSMPLPPGILMSLSTAWKSWPRAKSVASLALPATAVR